MVTSGLAMDVRCHGSWQLEGPWSDNVSGTASCAGVKLRNVP